MTYRDLADTSADKAWEAFRHAENEYQADPKNKEKLEKSRAAFAAYDKLRWQIHFQDKPAK